MKKKIPLEKALWDFKATNDNVYTFISSMSQQNASIA